LAGLGAREPPFIACLSSSLPHRRPSFKRAEIAIRTPTLSLRAMAKQRLGDGGTRRSLRLGPGHVAAPAIDGVRLDGFTTLHLSAALEQQRPLAGSSQGGCGVPLSADPARKKQAAITSNWVAAPVCGERPLPPRPRASRGRGRRSRRTLRLAAALLPRHGPEQKTGSQYAPQHTPGAHVDDGYLMAVKPTAEPQHGLTSHCSLLARCCLCRGDREMAHRTASKRDRAHAVHRFPTGTIRSPGRPGPGEEERRPRRAVRPGSSRRHSSAGT